MHKIVTIWEEHGGCRIREIDYLLDYGDLVLVICGFFRLRMFAERLTKHTCFVSEEEKKIIDQNFNILIGYFSPTKKILHSHITYFLDIFYKNDTAARRRLELNLIIIRSIVRGQVL